MDNREKANQLVMTFGNMLTVKDLHLSEETNSCVLVFDGDIILNIEYEESRERMIFSVYLDELPEDNAEPLLRELMGANLYWHQTRGATFCLEPGTGGLIMIYPHGVDQLTDVMFETVVQNMVDQAEFWKNKIADMKTQARSAESADPASSSQENWIRI